MICLIVEKSFWRCSGAITIFYFQYFIFINIAFFIFIFILILIKFWVQEQILQLCNCMILLSFCYIRGANKELTKVGYFLLFFAIFYSYKFSDKIEKAFKINARGRNRTGTGETPTGF